MIDLKTLPSNSAISLQNEEEYDKVCSILTKQGYKSSNGTDYGNRIYFSKYGAELCILLTEGAYCKLSTAMRLKKSIILASEILENENNQEPDEDNTVITSF